MPCASPFRPPPQPQQKQPNRRTHTCANITFYQQSDGVLGLLQRAAAAVVQQVDG